MESKLDQYFRKMQNRAIKRQKKIKLKTNGSILGSTHSILN